MGDGEEEEKRKRISRPLTLDPRQRERQTGEVPGADDHTRNTARERKGVRSALDSFTPGAALRQHTRCLTGMTSGRTHRSAPTMTMP
jgi:hypothetical protein